MTMNNIKLHDAKRKKEFLYLQDYGASKYLMVTTVSDDHSILLDKEGEQQLLEFLMRRKRDRDEGCDKPFVPECTPQEAATTLLTRERIARKLGDLGYDSYNSRVTDCIHAFCKHVNAIVMDWGIGVVTAQEERFWEWFHLEYPEIVG